MTITLNVSDKEREMCGVPHAPPPPRRPGRLRAAETAPETDTSLQGSDPCAPDLVETKSFVER